MCLSNILIWTLFFKPRQLTHLLVFGVICPTIYDNDITTLERLVIHVLSQTCSAPCCE